MGALMSRSDEWQALQGHAEKIRHTHLRDLFGGDAGRGERMSAQAADLYVDYSKHLATDETVQLLLALAEKARLRDRIAAMFAGEHINRSEDRAVLHVALRMPRDASLVVDGQDVVAEVHDVLDRMAGFSEQVRSGQWRGPTGGGGRTGGKNRVGRPRPRPGGGAA